MLHIIAGDDTKASREKFLALKDEYKKNKYEVISFDSSSLDDLRTWLSRSLSLFASKKAFFGENLLSKKEHKELLKQFDRSDDDVNIFLWEEQLEERLIRFIFKNARIYSTKFPHTIFKLLDAIYPSNRANALLLLDAVSKTINEHMILVMLARRARELILIKGGLTPEKKLAQWQMGKLKSHARLWDEKKLIAFYDALYRIEVLGKTSAHYYSIKKALDILICYFL